MKRKRLFWRILLVLLLFSLIRNWKDVKEGFMDGINDAMQTAPITVIQK